jgi:hypothetical protein
MEKVDVIINVYGKPYQTLCTLKSLMEHCESHIDMIYFINERYSLFNDDAIWITKCFSNIDPYIPPVNHEFNPRKEREYYNDKINRWSLKYQYGLEKSDKKYVFVTHNDILYTGDIIGEMLSQIEDNVGIGLIGQCWNCPANSAGVCNGDKMNKYNPTYTDVLELMRNYIAPRTSTSNVDMEHPMPLPECRLNEFACIIDRETTVKECWPNGDTPLFGSLNGIHGVDMGCEWFRSMVLKGYKFQNYDIYKTSQHGYFSPINSGLITQKDETLYRQCEMTANYYFLDHYDY